MAGTDYDILIIGGGINGAGIARDAAGRGYSVLLCEMNDLASGTSSWSTKLIHGGLRYLEYYEFRLVREALREREVLWGIAPHIIWPLRFVLPHHEGLRPSWLLRTGLFLYDHLGGRKRLPATRTVDLRHDPAGKPLAGDYRRGFEYSDCWVDDSRLVVLNARSAAALGAEIRTRAAVTSMRRDGDHWVVGYRDDRLGQTVEATARVVINAAGPWVDKVLSGPGGQGAARNVRLVQGSHIVVRRLFDHDRCYIFQNVDGRIVFAIPYERDFTLIGTTDRDYEGDPANAAISDAEIDYLCAAASEYFVKPVGRDDIVWTYSGVRPLYDDGASKAHEATRDYVLKMDGGGERPALVNIFGGKITTYRRLAEAILDKVGAAIGPRGRSWTATKPLPGGDFPVDGYDRLVAETAQAHPAPEPSVIARLVRAYGTDVAAILGGVRSEADLGHHFGAGLYRREVDFLMDREWALGADDIVWRRSKLGLRLRPAEIDALDRYMKERIADGGVAAAQ